MKRNKRVVILGDSLSMPRPEEGVRYEDTYAHLLHREGYEVVNRSKRANDTSMQTAIQNLQDDIIEIEPDIIVVFLGIVDCAPRIFSRFESKLLSFLPGMIRRKILNFVSWHRYRITKIRNKTYVSQNEYRKNILKLIDTANDNGSKIVFVNTIETTKENDLRSFNFIQNIKNYNQVLADVCKKKEIALIDISRMTHYLLADGIHINFEMHKILFESLRASVIEEKALI